MYNPFGDLRLDNILSGISSLGGNQTFGNQQPDMSGMFQNQPPMIQNQPIQQMFPPPDLTMEHKLNSFIDSFPQPQSPSIWNRIAGSLAGVSQGPEAALKLNYAPYQQQVSNWLQQGNFIDKAADNERSANNQNEMNNIRFGQLGVNQQKADDARNNAETKAKISQQRADAYQHKIMHPDWKEQTLADGTIAYVNPQDPSQHYETGLTSNQLTMADREQLIKDQGANQIANTQEQGKQRLGEIAATGEQNRLTKVVPSPNVNGAKPPSESQNKIGVFNKAQKAIIEHPEWAPYIHLATGNNITVDPPAKSTPGMLWGTNTTAGPDEATHQAISDYIYGSTPDSTAPNTRMKITPVITPQSNTRVPDPQVQAAIEQFKKSPQYQPVAGKVMVYNKDTKQFGYIPQGVAQAAIKSGMYIEVK